MYVLLAEDAYVEKTKGGDTTDLWHAWLGHVNYHKLKMMMTKSSLRGLPNLDVHTDVVYDDVNTERRTNLYMRSHHSELNNQ